MKLVEGQLIHNRYRLDRRLAQGGMGEVWKGYDIQLGRVVAIKALRGDLTDVEAKRRRLRIEAHNSADLAHPNIAALFDYYEHDGIGFLIMEYVDSESLADLYREKGAIDPLELLPILVQVARGLYVAHSHGVIHRDVKPANIMVSKDGQVKITDFGVSYSTNQAQITQDGMVVGTAQYISPEQAQGKKATPQSDIYSLGVVAYEGLCGHRPFTGATPVDIAAAHVNEAVPPLPDTVDVQLAQFVMSMLSKDPLDRPKDALVVSRTLSHIERRLMDQQAALDDTTIVSRDGRVARRVVSAPYASDGSVSGNPVAGPKHRASAPEIDDGAGHVVEDHVERHAGDDDPDNTEIDDSTLGSETRNVIVSDVDSANENGKADSQAKTQTADVNEIAANKTPDTASDDTSNDAVTDSKTTDKSSNDTETETDDAQTHINDEFSPAARAAIQTMTQTLRAITDYQIPAIKTDDSVPVDDKPPQSPPQAETANAKASTVTGTNASASHKQTSSPITSDTNTANPDRGTAKKPAATDSSKSSSDAAGNNIPVTEGNNQAANTENRKEQQ